jgi:hypothetical protein
LIPQSVNSSLINDARLTQAMKMLNQERSEALTVDVRRGVMKHPRISGDCQTFAPRQKLGLLVASHVFFWTTNNKIPQHDIFILKRLKRL